MATPSDYLTLITNQLIALLSAQPYFNATVLIGNRYSMLTGVQWPIRPNPASGNCPRVIIDAPAGRMIARNSERTFSNARSATGDVIVVREVTFSFRFLYDTTDRFKANQMDYAIDGALLADPKLGLTNPIIRTSGENMTRDVKEENSADTGGTNRVIQRIKFPVVVELHRADLIAAAAYAG